MWLTLATFVGYAVIYTVLLKPATPQNIVIGGRRARCRPSLAGQRSPAMSPPSR
jgi:protoheme IX farnesyltransferase